MVKNNNFSKVKFDSDLAQGKDAEHYVCNFLNRWFPTASVFDGKNKGYDIDIPEKEEQMEVKYDRLSKDTGNLAIEYECRGKPSGIEVTTSQRWCIIFGKDDGWFFAFVEVPVLRSLCQGKRTVSGGDGYLSKMYLLPITELVEHPFVKVHPLIK